MKKFIALFILFAMVSMFGQADYQIAKPRPVCKVSRLGPKDVAITCLNGAEPVGRKAGSVLLISCGSELAKQ